MELCSQRVPYSSMFLTPLQVAIGVADRGLRPPMESSDIPILVRQVVDSCLAQDPFHRPNFVTLVAQLKAAVAAAAAAEANAEAVPSLISRVSLGLGMLQGSGAGSTASAPGANSHGHINSNTGGPQLDGVRIQAMPVPMDGDRNFSCSPHVAHSSSRSGFSSSHASAGLSSTGGVRLPGMGNASVNSSGAAQAIAGSAHAAAGKASAMLTGFLRKGRSSPRQ